MRLCYLKRYRLLLCCLLSMLLIKRFMQTEYKRSYRRNIVLCVLALFVGYMDSLYSLPLVANPAI